MKESMAEEEASEEIGDMKANIKGMVMNQRAASSKKNRYDEKISRQKKREPMPVISKELELEWPKKPWPP